MKRKIFSLAAVVTLTAVAAFAADKASVRVASTTTLNGVEIKDGDYEVRWTANGDTADVTIAKYGKEIAKTRAKVISKKNNNSAMVSRVDGEGKKSVVEIQLKNGKSLVVENGGTSTDAVAAQ